MLLCRLLPIVLLLRTAPCAGDHHQAAAAAHEPQLPDGGIAAMKGSQRIVSVDAAVAVQCLPPSVSVGQLAPSRVVI
uniref:Putative secreted peptide n=1 Tax=Anopheles braziliensis TaxID=58242 RepID=A0A2M3ZT38_9DIPT